MQRKYPHLRKQPERIVSPIEHLYKNVKQKRSNRFRRRKEKIVLKETVQVGEVVEFSRLVVPIKGAAVSMDSRSPFRHRTKVA